MVAWLSAIFAEAIFLAAFFDIFQLSRRGGHAPPQDRPTKKTKETKVKNRKRRHNGERHAEREFGDICNGAEYFRSHGKRYGYKKPRVWTQEKRRLYREGMRMLDDGFHIEVVVNVIREVSRG